MFDYQTQFAEALTTPKLVLSSGSMALQKLWQAAARPPLKLLLDLSLDRRRLRCQGSNELKKKLFDAYNGFADKRVKNLDIESLFIIDDRREADEDAAGKLFIWFWRMFADVVDKNTVKIIMHGDVPDGPLVTKLFALNDAEKSNFGFEIVSP